MSLEDNLFLGSMQEASTRWNLANHKLTKAPKKVENKEQNERTKKTNEPPKRVNHKGNLKFPNHLLLQEAFQLRKGEEDLLKGCLA